MRIISLVPSHTETLFYLGLGEQVVGVTEHCDFPPEAGDRERVGYFGRPDLSRIVSLRPDLVVSGGSVHRETVEHLRKAGIEVFDFQPLSVAALLDGMESLMRFTADATNISRVNSLRTKLHRLEEIGRAGKHSPRLVFLAGGADMYVPGFRNWQFDAFRLCGAYPLPTTGDAMFVHVAWADIKAFDPEVVWLVGATAMSNHHGGVPAAPSRTAPAPGILQPFGKTPLCAAWRQCSRITFIRWPATPSAGRGPACFRAWNGSSLSPVILECGNRFRLHSAIGYEKIEARPERVQGCGPDRGGCHHQGSIEPNASMI